ncbi:HAMP domain-containing histidine kinase [Mucilaginibacter sp. UR6-1]|uniref:sensor histidine kinase n=1 Tax=Mucilaginibacter sp. UR6-1 TaxID=1435643 RepID=UPI001E56BA78|nr:HAMP domain-containing sensor histidine kinase [Mucilaginibacter sp. UR6-1]MCC8410632.1 HAMP domain-containing histidine kinase [Mucilaginibacter sp. UR6-1]
MKKRSIGLIIGLMGFALLGVMAMQFYFLRQSYLMQSELFDQTVNEALNNVAHKVAKQDAMKFLNAKANDNDRVVAIKQKQITITQNLTAAPAKKNTKKYKLDQKKRALLRDSLNRMRLRKTQEELLQDVYNFRIRVEEYTDEYGDVYGRMIPEVVRRDVKPAKRAKKPQKYDTLRYVYLDPQFGKQIISVPRINPLWQQEQDHIKKEQQLAKIKRLLEVDSLQSLAVAKAPEVKSTSKTTVIENLAEEYSKTNEPLTKRVSKFWIDSLLRFELHNKGIYLPFSYEVLTATNDSLIFANAMDTNKGTKPVFVASNTYQTPIFSNEMVNDPGKIRIAFPQKSSLILGRMGASMATTAGLLFVLVFCFGYTIFSILRQKKISEMKIDFINNMTHEFKTPVSTIMIASEALKDDEMTGDKARVSRLANIIYEENVRLGSHIERVLNIARLEKDDFKLDTKPVDVNEMVSLVLDSMALKLQKCGADVTVNLDAEKPMIIADELHFSNVLYNLIDNAIKYSKDEPVITISTLNKNGSIIIRVADKGIGMGRDQQAKIFEQFYRIPTGNLHDVKGFGLGLSYVNSIVKKLNGTIGVRSEKEKGSEFELKFPLA